MIELAKELRGEVEQAAARFRTMNEADAAASRGAEKWSRKEVLGHLIDSACNNHQRFVRARFADPFVGPGYDQVEWVKLHRYRDRPWADLVDLWVAMNRQLAEVIEHTPAEKLQTALVIGAREPLSLEWWIRDYLRHVKHHLAQIADR